LNENPRLEEKEEWTIWARYAEHSLAENDELESNWETKKDLGL
jgi:hypothetical protein